jgi:hypothetical protein
MNGAIDDDEAQAIAMVHFRKATLIIDEKRDETCTRILP